jgi:hypothetical protein
MRREPRLFSRNALNSQQFRAHHQTLWITPATGFTNTLQPQIGTVRISQD